MRAYKVWLRLSIVLASTQPTVVLLYDHVMSGRVCINTAYPSVLLHDHTGPGRSLFDVVL